MGGENQRRGGSGAGRIESARTKITAENAEKGRGRRRTVKKGWRAVFVWLALVCWAGSSGAAEPDWVKVAAGEYEFGADDKQVSEVWVLWRTPQGYVVEGTSVSKSKYEVTLRATKFELDRNLHLQAYKLSPLPGTQEAWAGEFGCRSEPTSFWCSETQRGFYGNEKPREFSDGITIDPPHDLIPVLPWFAGSIVRRLKLEEEKTRSIQVIGLDDGGGNDPVDFFPLIGEVTHVGVEQLSVAGHEFTARKFEVRLKEPRPDGRIFMSFAFWVSPEGVVLVGRAMNIPGSNGELFRLVRYKKYAEFGVGK